MDFCFVSNLIQIVLVIVWSRYNRGNMLSYLLLTWGVIITRSLLHSKKGSWVNSISLEYWSLNWGETRMLNACLQIKLWHCVLITRTSLLDLRSIQLTVRVIFAVSATPWLKLATPKQETSTSAHKTEKDTNVSLQAYRFFGSFTLIYLIMKVCDLFLWALATQIPWNLSPS